MKLDEKTRKVFNEIYGPSYALIQSEFGRYDRRFWITAVKANEENYNLLNGIDSIDENTIDLFKKNAGDNRYDNLIDILLTKLITGSWVLSAVYDGRDLFDKERLLISKMVKVNEDVEKALENEF